MSASAGSSNVADRELVFTRLLDAPRELVYKMWTNPAHLIQWYGPKGFVTSVYQMDVRPGGEWRLTMRGPDGKDYKNHIVFVEVKKPERLVFKHVPEAGSEPVTFETTVTFAEEQGKTRVTLRMLFPTEEEKEFVVKKHGAKEGGEQMFGKLADYMRTMAPGAAVPIRQVTLTRLIDAPRELVFRAWTEPEQMKHWWGPNGFTTVRCELEPRAGGALRIDMRGPDGTLYPHSGTVREFVRPERLVLFMNVQDGEGNIIFEGVTTVTLVEEAGKTRLTLHSRIENASVEFGAMHGAGMENGWNQALDHLEKQLSESKEHSS
ncbi:MAG TPA: SRPBCC domain-containing protein [Bryobacteraceae bacterium]|nr:SRPBCC domain-containing protein [Bryobacteraceae bacterium]